MGVQAKHGGANAFVELVATGFTAVVLHLATVLMRTISVFDDGLALAMRARWVCGGGYGSQGVAMSVFYTSSFLRPVPITNDPVKTIAIPYVEKCKKWEHHPKRSVSLEV